MTDILVAADEVATTELLRDGEVALGMMNRTGGGSLGPFNTNWVATAFLSGGTVNLSPPNIVSITDCELHFSLNFALSFDLSSIIPNFCLPQVCIKIKWLGTFCTPKICIDWPTITIPVQFQDKVKFSSDFRVAAYLAGSEWLVDFFIIGIPNLQIGPIAGLLLTAIGLAAAAVLVGIPFIGLFLGGAVAVIMAAIGIAGVTGFLGPILTLFVAGLRISVYRQQRTFIAFPPNPPLDLTPVFITLDRVVARVQQTNEVELLLETDIS